MFHKLDVDGRVRREHEAAEGPRMFSPSLDGAVKQEARRMDPNSWEVNTGEKITQEEKLILQVLQFDLSLDTLESGMRRSCTHLTFSNNANFKHKKWVHVVSDTALKFAEQHVLTGVFDLASPNA